MSLADARTLEAIDFAGVRERVVGLTHTERGKVLATQLSPLTDFAEVRREQLRTETLRSLVAGGTVHVMRAVDTAPLTAAAQVGRSLSGSDLRAIGDAVAAAASAQRAVREHPELAGVVAAYTPLQELQRSIVDALDERGVVLDRASHALGRIRRSLAQAQAGARDRMSSILNSAKHEKAIQDRIVTVRDGRFVIPIKAEFAGSLPGIVHDTSASGQTLFIEPLAALETNNRVRTLQIDEEREVRRILEALSAEVGRNAAAIETNVEMLAVIDLLAAKAELAQRTDAVAPELTDDAVLAIERGRHPLLGERAVPQSLAVDDATRLLVISGPNMGGKTVALKMAGLFVVMAYCGMQLPAANGTRIGRFERLIVDIGDEQSLVANASTFSAHLQRIREILDGAGPRTLAIIDEIGGGTEPSAGAALARAMLERLLECGARALVSTHSMELKLFAHSTPGVANASVRFDPQTFAPTFELDVGTPGQSLAFPLAARLGIDPQIVERAAALLERRERDYEAALAELAVRSAELREARAGLEAERREASGELERVRGERTELETQRRRFAARAEDRLQQSLRDFVRELQRRAAESGSDSERKRKGKVSSSQAALLAQTIEAIRRDLGIVADEHKGSDDRTFEPGDRVRILSLNQEGFVAEDYDERLLVSVGSMKMLVEKSDVRREASAVAAARGAGAASARLSAAARASEALDVRGKRYAEAEPLVERWIDDALLAGNSPLRLIHGKGTGMLGRGLQEYLRTHPGVKSLRYGNEEEGSTGVTMIELRT
ncbi:MAG TPA: Smr/MutS family protein [Candidatus Cybelea sp.]